MLAALAELRERGVRIGLSTSGPEQGRTVERAIETGGFDTVQATWNLLEPSAGPALAAAHEAGMGVIVKEALANGRLTSRGGDPRARRGRAQARGDPRRRGPGRRAGAAVGRRRPERRGHEEQLASNLAAWELPWDDEAAAALAGLAEEPETYWRERSDMQWN